MPAPGFDKWQKCSGGMSTTDPLNTSQPDGMDLGLFIEYFDAVNGVAGQGWSPNGGIGSGGFNQNIIWDSMGNSASARKGFPLSKRPHPGEVSAFAIGGQPMGCMMYMGRGSAPGVPMLFPAATPDPYGQIPPGQLHYWEPKAVSVVMDPFHDCNACVYGAVDPGGPGGDEEEMMMDKEHMASDNPTFTGGIETGVEIELEKNKSNMRSRPPVEDLKTKNLREEVNRIKGLMKKIL